MFGGAKLSAEVQALLDATDYRAKSIAAVYRGDDTINLLTWSPFSDDPQWDFILDVLGTAYVAAWNIDNAEFLTWLEPEDDEIHLEHGWRPITDEDVVALTEAVFGELGANPLVVLAPVSASDAGCRACRGDRFGGSLDLAIDQRRLCTDHRAAAEDTLAELADLAVEHPESWRACDLALLGLRLNHVPQPLRQAVWDYWECEDDDKVIGLGEQGDLLCAVLEPVHTERDLEDVLLQLEIDDFEFTGWSDTVAYRLGRDHDFERAASLIDALVRGRPADSASLHGEFALQLAEAGQVDDARARLAKVLDLTGRDPLAETIVGDVYDALGEPDEARRWYETAIASVLADPDADPALELEAWQHLDALATGQGWDDVAETARANCERLVAKFKDTQVTTAMRDDIATYGHKVGRNDPCPCGSDRKYKACCGRH